MPGVRRLVNKVDFERLLSTRSLSRSAHFALHHVMGSPAAAIKPPSNPGSGKLSTADQPVRPEPVDDLSASCWFGCVVPKRHARRAVTRNLIKRQVRQAMLRHGQTLPAGLWLVRLRAPFAPASFVSARSAALAQATRAELDLLLSTRGRSLV